MSRSTEEKRRRILSSPFSHHFSFVEREEASKTRCSTLSGTRFGAALSTRSPPPSPSPSLLALALSSQSGAQGQEAQEGTTEGRDGGKAADRSQYRLVVHGEGHSQAQAHLGERERGSVHGAALHEPVHVSLFFSIDCVILMWRREEKSKEGAARRTSRLSLLLHCAFPSADRAAFERGYGAPCAPRRRALCENA